MSRDDGAEVRPTDQTLAHKVVAITGGNRGIGRTIARVMAQAGGTIVIGTRDPDTVEHLQAEFDGEFPAGRIDVLPCDVTEAESTAQFAERLLERHGRIDTVVANAGIAGPTAPLHQVDPEAWRACVDVDLTGVFLTFRPFVPHMIEQRDGRLIALSSITGKRPLSGRSPYAAAKMGVIGLIRTLALEVGCYGITANTVCAGSVDGPRLESVIRADARARELPYERVRALHESAVPLQRLVTAEEVGQACVFLAGPSSAAITGEDINVSAGAVMY